jgi:hypothetical protein
MKNLPSHRASPALSGPVILILAAAAVAALYEWAVFATTFVRPGMIGPNFTAVGADWMVYHGAARAYFDGHGAMLYDGDRFTALLNHTYRGWLSAPLPFRPWVYPPSYLLLMAPFGLLSFLASFTAFQILTSAALVAALVVGAAPQDRKAWMIAGASILSPAAAFNATCGQNAALTAALMIGGFRLLGARPLLAGALLGLLTVKPQFAVLAPVALVASGQWRALLAFVGSAAALVLVSLAVFGLAAWVTWAQLMISSIVSPSSEWIIYGRMWGNSVWTCAVLLGASSKAASVLQLGAVIVAAGAVAYAFVRSLNLGARLAVLLAAACLASPHWCAYDALPLTAGALIWLLREPVRDIPTWRWMAFLLLWLMPLFSPPVIIPLGRLTPILLVGFIAAVIWREGDLRVGRRHSAPAPVDL